MGKGEKDINRMDRMDRMGRIKATGRKENKVSGLRFQV
jgi:hypothetical protein